MDRPHPGRAIRGPVCQLERAGQRRVLPAERRGAASSPHLSFDIGPTLGAWLAEADPSTACPVRGRRPGGDRPALPPRDPAARVGRRPADRDRLGDPGFRAAVRSSARRGSGCPRPRWTGRRCARRRARASSSRSSPRGRPPGAGSTARRPYRVELGDGRLDDRDLLRREPVGRGLLRAGGDSRRRPVRARADRSPPRSRRGPRRRPLAVIATDGELYGHHQQFRDLFLQRLVDPAETGLDRGFDLVTPRGRRAEARAAGAPRRSRIADRTSWSCHHGVARWGGECPDAPDGRWKAPLRAALERLAGAIDAIVAAQPPSERLARTTLTWSATRRSTSCRCDLGRGVGRRALAGG